jgi:charged multivesicular body protein 6
MGSLLKCPKSRTAKLDQQEQAIINCKITRDNIKAYIKRLEKNEEQRKAKAKEELRNKNRDKAKVFLNQSKFYHEQVLNATGQLNLIEEQISRIEMAQHQKEAIQVLEQGNKILKQLNEEVNVEKWEKIADDMNELKQQQDEIGNFLKSHGVDEQQYEEELDKELEDLIKLQNPEIEEKMFPDAGKEEVKEKERKSKVSEEEDYPKERFAVAV